MDASTYTRASEEHFVVYHKTFPWVTYPGYVYINSYLDARYDVKANKMQKISVLITKQYSNEIFITNLQHTKLISYTMLL